MTRPSIIHNTARSARDTAQRARADGLANGECRDTKIESWLGAAFVSQ